MNDFSKPQPALPATERTQYGYKNAEGHRLHIMADRILTGHVLVSVTGVGDLEPRPLNIPDVDVPGIALALLLAAGVVPKSEHYGLVDDPARSLRVASHYLTTYIEQTQRALIAAAELTRRRDELASEIDEGATCYEATCAVARHAIDMIITLQDEAQK